MFCLLSIDRFSHVFVEQTTDEQIIFHIIDDNGDPLSSFDSLESCLQAGQANHSLSAERADKARSRFERWKQI